LLQRAPVRIVGEDRRPKERLPDLEPGDAGPVARRDEAFVTGDGAERVELDRLDHAEATSVRKGLFSRSLPTVVIGPWPGSRIVSAGSARIARADANSRRYS